MRLFTGRFTHVVDGKNRVSVPRKIVDTLRELGSPEEVVITTGLDGCLVLYTPQGFLSVGEQIENSPLGAVSGRDFRRNFFGSAEHCAIDRTGRLLLPELLKRDAGITDKALFLGTGHRVELWNPETYAQRLEQTREQFEEQAKDVLG